MNSTTTQPNLLELAKQGNAQAIATLINHQLKTKGITAKASLKNGCIQVMLESAQAPNQQSLVTFVRKGITGLGAASIERVIVYGRQTGEAVPAWSQEFELVLQTKPASLSLEVPTTNQPSITKVEPPKIKSLLPIQNTRPTSQNQKNHSSKTKATSKEDLASRAFKILFVLSIFLLFFNWKGSIITSITAYFVSTQTLEGKAATTRRKLEDKQKAEALAEAQKLKQKEEELKQEEKQKAYLSLLNPLNSPVKQLHTNLPKIALEELRKVQARVNIGVSYRDLPSVLAPAKLVVQKFERSKDYSLSVYLSELITQTMYYYELSLECFKRKIECITNPSAIPAITLESEIGKVIKQEFPNLNTVSISELTQIKLSALLVADLSGRYYDFDHTVQAAWAKASEYLDRLEKILEIA
jgi:hypothetical protein